MTDIGQLFNFEVQQANGYSPLSSLANATDAQVATPGLPLSFARTFAPGPSRGIQFGSFGWGWSDSWETSLTVDPDGSVNVLRAPDGSLRRFQPDSPAVTSLSPATTARWRPCLAAATPRPSERPGQGLYRERHAELRPGHQRQPDHRQLHQRPVDQADGFLGPVPLADVQQRRPNLQGSPTPPGGPRATTTTRPTST